MTYYSPLSIIYKIFILFHTVIYMTYKQHIKRNRNNTVRARASARKNMRKRNSYRYSGRGGIIDDIKAGIDNATQVANSRLSAVADRITKSDAMKRIVGVSKVFNTPEDKANAAKKLLDTAAEKVKSIQDKLEKHQGEKDKLTQELSKAQKEHMNALKKLNLMSAPTPSMKRPASASSMKRPASAPSMKMLPFNRTKYGS